MATCLLLTLVSWSQARPNPAASTARLSGHKALCFPFYILVSYACEWEMVSAHRKVAMRSNPEGIGVFLICYINNSSLSFIYADGSLNSHS